MKNLFNFFTCTFLLIPCLCSAQTPTSSTPATTQPAIVARDANSRTWEWTESQPAPNGQTVQQIHRYTELATGLCYQQNGQWQDSREQISIQPDGSASATQGEHQVYFPADIYNGVITLITPDGLQLKSQPVGLSYDDGTNTVLIAESTNAVGQLISSNQVIYTNAFAGVDADLLYTYTKAGFEQDVIFREQPPTPEQFGLDSANTRLQMLTEFLNPPTLTETVGLVNPQDGLQDTILAFGAMRMVRGRAFLINTPDDQDDPNEISVYKSVVTVNGRTLLIEQVPYQRISPQLTTLPFVSANISNTVSPALGRVSAKRLLPPVRLAETVTNSVRLARAEIKKKSGVVLDYITMNSSETNFTFQGDMTYYVSGDYLLSGTTVLEGGTIIKMNSSGELDIDDANGDANAAIDCETTPYRPAIFTSYNDNSLGEQIGSGSPSYADVGTYLFMSQTTNIALSNVRFSYCLSAIYEGASSSSITVRDCQFYQDRNAVDGWNINLYNVLMSFSTFARGALVILNGPGLVAEQVTADDDNFAFVSPAVGSTMALTNCIITSTNATFELAESGGTLETNDVAFLIQPSQPVYQTVGGGNYYLTNGSPYRDYGTTNVDPDLLADLAKKTTWPPVVYDGTNISSLGTLNIAAWRDTNAFLDLGYHYDPLDYAFGGCDLHSNLTVTTGVAIAWFEDYGNINPSSQPCGMTLNNGAYLSFNGNATQPCHVAYFRKVQEGGNSNWSNIGSGWYLGLIFNGSNTNQEPQISANFMIATASEGMNVMQDRGAYGSGMFKNCEFYVFGITTYDEQSLNFTNCLLFRVPIAFWDNDYDLSFNFESCTFYSGGWWMYRSGKNPSFWQVQNSSFDDMAIYWSDSYNGATNHTLFDYNAYNTSSTNWEYYPPLGTPLSNTLETVSSSDVMVTNYNWETSWFGNFYLPTNSPVLHMGSTNANLLGLYHFTTQTNQTVEGTNTVTIGYHYVATDQYGNPLDSNGDGIPDYLEDPSGMGIWGPQIVLIAPTTGAYYTEPATIPISATVSDWSSIVTNVDFVQSNSLQGTASITVVANAPYSYSWPIVAANQYTLTGIAQDLSGLAATSSVVNVTVTNLCGY